MLVEWAIYLKLVHFAAVGFCLERPDTPTLYNQQECVEEVKDCVFDGETFVWCTTGTNALTRDEDLK
jgi:hypothetical protein